MRIAIVGPTFPYKGGVAQHTELLAHNLRRRGHDPIVETWADQYPQHLYPGQQRITEPEVPRFEPTRRRLSWHRPYGWWKVGRHLARDVDALIMALVTPLQVPAYLAIAHHCNHAGIPVLAVCHNVLPHEPRPTDRILVRRLLRAVDGVIVHSSSEASQARVLGAKKVGRAGLPFFFPDVEAVERMPGRRNSLLFFGFVRPYKGLDILLDALQIAHARPNLIVAGEMWHRADDYQTKLDRMGLSQRVDLRTEYLPARYVPAVFAEVDALVVPYLSGTGSQHPRLGHRFGVPVIATSVGDLTEQVRHGVDGLICPPNNSIALSAAIDTLYAPGALEELTAGVSPPDVEAEWDRYVDAVLATARSHGTD